MAITILELSRASGWIVWFFIAAFVFVGLCWLKSWFRAVYLAVILPGPPALPILGNIFEIKDNKGFVQLGKTAHQKYGPMFRAWLAVLPLVIVLEPKHLQRILGSTKLTDKNFLYSLMHTFIGEGLITSSGSKWKSHRKYIQPYFDLNTLSMFIQTFVEGAQAMVEELKGEMEVEITTYINRCILDILHQAILGISSEEKELKKQSPFTKGHIILTERIIRPWLLLNFVYKLTFSAKEEFQQKLTLHEFSKKILEQRRRDKEHGKTLRWCFLEIFMEVSENNPDFSDNDIVAEACTFMLAGQDSVGAALAFTLFYLAKHQDIQEKVIEEINDAFSTCETVNVDVLNKMKYLEQCIKEAMRLCPSVPIIARKLSEDVKIGKYNLPAGCNVLISPYVTHRLPDYYPDPEKFDPERFSVKSQEKRNPFAYIPFSAGPRNCIGYKFAMLEMKTIVSIFLRNYKISAVPGREPEVYYRVTLRAKGGVWLKLHAR